MIIDGKKIADGILADLKTQISKIDKDDRPSITVFIVGNDPASEIYVKMKDKKAKELGINSCVSRLVPDISQKDLEMTIKCSNQDDETHAALVQLPLPKQIDANRIFELLDPKKDVDGLTAENIGRLVIGAEPYAEPCTPKGIMRLLDAYNIPIEGKKAVVIGRSNLVGKPIAAMLLARNATVTMTHSKTKNLSDIVKDSDIVIAAIGQPNFIKGEWIKEGATVIDVGINKIDGKLIGDVEFDVAKEKAAYITPVPGGVGPMTIAMLFENTFNLYKQQKGQK